MKRHLAVALLVVLVGCAGNSAKNTVAALAVALTGANNAALAYVNLPLCGSPGASAICSRIEIIRDVDKASTAAGIAVRQADTAAWSVTASTTDIEKAIIAAQAAVNVLTQITSTLPKRN